MFSDLRRQLFRSRTFQLTLLSLVFGFGFLWLADTQLSMAMPGAAEILRSLGIAALTSGFIGFTFEFSTRIGFAEMIEEIVSRKTEELENRLEQFENRLLGKPIEEDPLTSFWRPFITEDSVIVIAQNERGNESTVRSADLLAAFTLQQGMIDLYSKKIKDGNFKLRIGTVNKFQKLQDNNLPFVGANLILIGAPGANPLSSYLFSYLKGVDQESGKVSDGYVFGIDEAEKENYALGPFIVPVPAEEVGIEDLIGGITRTVYRRFITKRIDMIDEDSCLLVHGTISQLSGPVTKERRFLIIAGHSRYSTQCGAQFVIENTDWVDSIVKATNNNMETLLRIRTTGGSKPEIWVAHPPRAVIRHPQSPSGN